MGQILSRSLICDLKNKTITKKIILLIFLAKNRKNRGDSKVMTHTVLEQNSAPIHANS